MVLLRVGERRRCNFKGCFILRPVTDDERVTILYPLGISLRVLSPLFFIFCKTRVILGLLSIVEKIMSLRRFH